MRIALTAAALALLPTAAHADWTHKDSGIAIADTVGGMARGAERDLTNGEKADVYVQYGTDAEPVTVYVYRSSHPNPALWFDRTRAAMISRLSGVDAARPPRPITLGGSPTANGLRQDFTLANDGPWTATSVALAQAGEWMVKVRVTSQTLDQAGVAAKMEAMLGALRFARPVTAALPLVVPAACPAALAATGRPDAKQARVAAGSVYGAVAIVDARQGGNGLAGEPAKWCRDDVGALSKAITLYHRIDGTAWTALIGDAGITANAYALDAAVGGGGAVFFIRTGAAQLAMTYDALPSFEAGLSAVMPLISGKSQPLASISATPR
jgi:hypothetical protein